MSTPLPPSAPDDELVSAYLDDALPDSERQRVEADARLMARVAELASVRDAIRSPVEPPGRVQREVAIAAALDAAPPSAATPLVSRRQWPRVLAVVGAAAAIALVVTLVAVRNRHGAQSTSATSVATSASEAAAATPPLATRPAAAGPSTTAPAVGSAAVAAPNEEQPGPSASGASAVSTASNGGSSTEGATIDAPDQLAALALALADNIGTAPAHVCPSPRPGAAYRGTFTWRGTPAELFSVTDAQSGRPVLAIAVASADCRLLASATVG